MNGQRTAPFVLAFAAALLSSGMNRVAAQDAKSLNPVKGVEKASLRSFLQRPLFDPSRRAPVPVPRLVEVRASVVEEPPPSIHLLGVIRGIRDMAVVRRSGEKKTAILRSGDYVGKWIVTVVPPIGVRLRCGDRAFEYTLFASLKSGPAPVALAPGPVATGPTDAVGMPMVMPSSWGMAPN